MEWFSGSLKKFTGLLILTLILGGCGGESKPVQLKGKALGTTYSIVIYDLPNNLSPETLNNGIEQVVGKVNSAMSLFKPESELSQFNDYKGSDWFPVSKELAEVVKTAKEINKMTDGAFDITIAPLVNLWGFGHDKQTDIVPNDAEIKEKLSNVGSTFVEVSTNPPELKKLKPTITIDLAAIAKGYCVDAVSNWLTSQKIKTFMVEIGGEIRTKGKKPNGEPWRIAVEKPVSIERAVQAVIAFTDKAMATSGDYRNYFEVDGKRYSHILDPTTGRPITHTLVSVSVMANTCARADALATGLTVLGPKRGIKLAKKNNLSAFFIVKTADGLVETATGNFPKHEKLN
ncbi:FAD:protein FMN transferase [Desulfovibrio sp. UCD-KL4C]|uniref:FAD:protein FMN transferase n=1 Tax=Desulfovibrio sp. UCD-KL4C TaxID=2578120 RepID=UPI0025C071BE|nr:FAD:protein FMN transferase [Desulfovibrio sp. UCD-KL4C]